MIYFCVVGFDFGVRQTGERVWNVSLPPWCRQNPRLFVLVHRQALESGYVTTDLAPWIDLVFGFKQHGKPAIDAVNVFHPAVSVTCALLFQICGNLQNCKWYCR